MVTGIKTSMRPLLWAIILLIFIMYMVAVVILPFVGLALAGDEHERNRSKLQQHFGSLMITMYTLYKSITAGVAWGDVVEPLMDINPLFAVLFSLYIAFALFCVLNIITGVFVDSANKLTMYDEESMLAHELEQRTLWYHDVQELFTKAISTDGAINLEQFTEWVMDVRTQVYFRHVGLNVTPETARSVFSLLDIDRTGLIDFDKFACGVDQIHGTARAVDVASLALEVKKLHRKLTGEEIRKDSATSIANVKAI